MILSGVDGEVTRAQWCVDVMIEVIRQYFL